MPGERERELLHRRGNSNQEEYSDRNHDTLVKSFEYQLYSGAKTYLVSHQLCKFSHLKR